MSPQPTAAELRSYRKERRGAISTVASVAIVLAILAGGCMVADALNQDAAGGAPSTATVTTRSAARSVSRVIEARLQKERLKVLLGIVEAPQQDADAVARLETVGRKEGVLALGVAAGDYVVSAIQERAPALSSQLAAQLRAADVQRRLMTAAADLRAAKGQEHRELLVKLVMTGSATKEWPFIVRRWAETLETDSSLLIAWRRLPAKPTPPSAAGPATPIPPSRGAPRATGAQPQQPTSAVHREAAQNVEPSDAAEVTEQAVVAPAGTGSVTEFLEQALAVANLPGAVAAQLASDVSVTTMPHGERELAGNDFSARLAWGIAAVLFIGLWAAAVSIGFWQMWTLVPNGSTWVIVTAIVATIVGCVSWSWGAIAPGNLELLGPLLMQINEESGTHVVQFSRGLTGLAAAAVVIMLAASAAVTRMEDAALLESQLEGLRSMFNVAAALLVAGAIEIAALYAWAAASFEPTPGGLSKAATLAAGFTGALFSAALVVLYLPAASTLRRRAPAGSPVPAEQGFSDSTFQQLARLLQAMAPLFAAVPVSAVVTLLS